MVIIQSNSRSFRVFSPLCLHCCIRFFTALSSVLTTQNICNDWVFPFYERRRGCWVCYLWYACWISRDIITEFPNPSIIWLSILKHHQNFNCHPISSQFDHTPDCRNTTRIEKMTGMLKALQNLTYRWQLVDICYDLLVPLDRLPGARPQRGAEVAKVAACGQNPPWHYPHFPSSLWFDQQRRNKLSKSFLPQALAKQVDSKKKELTEPPCCYSLVAPKNRIFWYNWDQTARANDSRQN